MATQINIAHRNAILAATGAIFNGGALDVRSAARTGADSAAGGTILSTVALPNPAFGTPSAGSMAKAGTWSGVVLATGEPRSYRLRNSGGTQIREGDASESGGTAMVLTGLVDGDLIQGGTLTIETYVITQSAGDAP